MQRLPSARDLAHRILLQVATADGHSNRLLRELPATMERRERSLCTELVLGTLRWQRRLDHALGQCSSRPLGEVDASLLTALRLGAYQILHLDRVPASAAVNESVRLARRASGRGPAGFVNAVLRALLRREIRWPPAEADLVERLSVETSHPRWLVRRWIGRLGEDEARRSLLAHNQPCPLVLRAAGEVELVRTRLAQEGVQTASGRWVHDALQVVEGHPLGGPAFEDGLFYVQDEASVLVARMLDAQPGERIADLCAAPGGKATDLARAVGPQGLLLACDLQPRRLSLVRHNVRRLRLRSVPLLVQDASCPALRPGRLDRVLLDAPCSGTGVLRRHPEIRWRRHEDDVRRMARMQSDLLGAAAELVRPGGVLVYSVCSQEPEEGIEVVRDFLQQRSDYSAGPPPGVPEELLWHQDGLETLRTDPLHHGMDGFFAAFLRRRSR